MYGINWESLNNCMNDLSHELKLNGELELAKIVEAANCFFGNTTPGEYMGESWLVFKEILKKREKLPDSMTKIVESKIKEIKEGLQGCGSGNRVTGINQLYTLAYFAWGETSIKP